MRVYVVRKWPHRGRSRFVCCDISKSVVTVQPTFRAQYAKDPPRDKIIRAWYKQFTETGCLCMQKAPMLMRVWQELEYRIDVYCVIHGAHTENL